MFSAMRKRRERRAVKRLAVHQVGFWWHSIDLGDGVVTPGFKTPELLANELHAIDMPEDLMGRSVLDIGTWDGFYAFEAERRGARRVVVVDHWVWSGDTTALQSGEWDPERLPGKRGFDLAHDTLQSSVDVVVADFMTMDTDALGVFDVVLYLGVLYHMEDPMRALRRLCSVTGGMAIIETEAIVIPGFEHTPLWRFFPGAELNNDPSNWWVPNLFALTGALDAVGFDRVELKVGPAPALLDADGGPHHYRAIVHAFKDPPSQVM